MFQWRRGGALIEVTDVIFAVDSIPAIFGLTQDTYLVFTAVAFSLLGLRQPAQCGAHLRPFSTEVRVGHLQQQWD